MSSFDMNTRIQETELENSKCEIVERPNINIGDQLNYSVYRSFLSGKEEDVSEEYNPSTRRRDLKKQSAQTKPVVKEYKPITTDKFL